MRNKNFSKIIALVAILAVSLSFYPSKVQSANWSLPFGSLIKIEGAKGAAVYHIASDGKKYIFPDQKTFETWYDDFSQVQSVSLSVLDSYPDGGWVPMRAGARLITHKNTAKVYAVGVNGQVIHIPNEELARKFYGNDWVNLVSDVDSGIFSLSYQVNEGELGEDNLPEESLVMDQDSGKYYLIENGLKRRVEAKAFTANKLSKKTAVILAKLEKLTPYYRLGEALSLTEESIYKFDYKVDNQKIVICHKPTVSASHQGKTIVVSQRALAAHLAHGDTLGACPTDADQDQGDTILPDIMAYDIGLSSDQPKVNQVITITAYVKNSGEVTLFSTKGILNNFRSFEDFETGMPSKIPNISEENPFEPGDIVAIEWEGYFNSSGEKRLYVVIDNANELEESDETNNTYTKYVMVFDEDSDEEQDINQEID